MTRLTTFDVFDTLVTRRVAEPQAVFLLLGTRLARSGAVPVSAEAFARQRAQAERLAPALALSGHATLADMYRVLAKQLELPPEWAARTADAELELERELIVPVPGAAARVARARTLGRVAYVSDMHLPSSFIRSILDAHGIAEEGEPLFVSAEAGMSKWDGSLFTHVRETLGAGAEHVHVGDNEISDIARPRELGIGTAPFTAARPSRYENRLESHRWASQGLSSALAGASRYARLGAPESRGQEQTIREVAADVAAPMLVGYVLWTLQRARELGLRRLYFVARDGQVLLDIARILERDAPEPLELEYLYGSRQSWYPAGVDPDQPLEALRRLEAFDDTLLSLLDRCGVDATAWIRPDAEPHSREGVRAEVERLASMPEFLAAVTQGLRARQDRLAAYALQAGLLDGASHGIVDVGWFGRSLAHFSDLLERQGGARPLGFYLGFLGQADRRAGAEIWLEGYEQRLGSLIIAVETFMAGTHGGVTDFAADEDGTMRPILQSEHNDPVLDWGLTAFRDSVQRFTEFFAETPASWPEVADCRDAIMDGLELFWHDPSVPEARAWGAFPWEFVALAATPKLLAVPRRFREHLRDSLTKGESSVLWPPGDRALAPETWKTVRRLGKAVARPLRRIRGR